MSDPLQAEQQADQERLTLLIQKRAAIQRACDLENDGARKFSYEQQLSELDKKIAPLKERLHASRSAPAPHVLSVWKPLLDEHDVRDDLRPAVTVNCNREEHYFEGLLNDFSKQIESKNNLFYCIVACPYQRPVSMAKRLVYEIEGSKIPIARQVDAAKPDEVVAATLEFGLTPELSWALFWGELKRRIGAAGYDADSPGALADQCADKRYIVPVHRLGKQQWRPDSVEHLRYIARQFQGLPETSRKYLLLFALEFPHIHDRLREKYQNDLEQLNALCAEMDTEGLRAACFSLLPPVEPRSIKDWSSDVLLRDTQLGFTKIIRQLQDQALGQDERFDMEQVETLQEAVWWYRNNRPRPNLPF